MDVVQETGSAATGTELRFKPGGRLDMNHGFLHHIRRNQIARDDYDKEVKEAKEKQKKRHSSGPARPRRPDIQVYHPRCRSGTEISQVMENEESNESSSSADPELHGTELFCLEYEADSGDVSSFIIHRDDDPRKVVELVAAENILDSGMKATLYQRIQQEIEKRKVKR
ncbi:UPF0561 protein C2orf68 homolog [Polypterus senegalus]|uniref:UPF0561 protein C2orf68 homolog n=1 Tax=Polypterus senegalus TaxID=55291 RepID=UPI0019652528|nr:UPF0561 protein C2orf68 homolog [Polypterus senegalus]